jgi:hypothetical protein
MSPLEGALLGESGKQMTDQIPKPAKLIIEALYASHLHRQATDVELKQCLDIVDTRGLAVLVKEIVSSSEAKENRELSLARQRSEALYPLRKITSLRTADHHTGVLLSEIVDEPVALRYDNARSIPPLLAERINNFSSLRVIKDDEPDIWLLSYESLDGVRAQPHHPLFMLVVLDDAQSYLDALATVRFRVDEASLLRAKTRRARELLENAGLQYTDLVYLGADAREPRLYPACIFETQHRADAEDPAALARYCGAALVFFHLFCNDSSRVAEALDNWDAVWGTDLSYRYNAISNAALE